LEGINKSFSGVKVLDNVHFTLKKGTIHSLVGGNGAGKSTLMKIITGVYTYDSGTIMLNGKRVFFNDYGDASNNGIRMIFQELSLIPTLTVTENIFLNHELKRKSGFIDTETMNLKACDLLKSLKVKIDTKAVVSDLSVGQSQLVEIAKALSEEAQILVMDEPTSSLPEAEVDILFDIMENLKRKGVSIIYISHRMNEILRISDEVTIIRDGRNILTEEATNLNIEYIVSNILGRKAEEIRHWHGHNGISNKRVALEVHDLCVNEWVRNISFSVHKGEIIGFAGLMDSGRTEVLEGIFGLRSAFSGDVSVEGRKVKLNNIEEAIDAGLALIPENRRIEGLILNHSIADNIILPSLRNIKSKFLLKNIAIKNLVNETINKYNIKTEDVSNVISALSGGNQQKVVISKWLTTDPKILLLDEPTIGIDIGAKVELLEIIRLYVSKGNAAIFVSSEISELLAICDRVLILKKGKIINEIHHSNIQNEAEIQIAIQN
jgi:ribose transport system ATP-binding protein